MPIFSPFRSASVWYFESLPTATAQFKGLVTYVPTILYDAVCLAMPVMSASVKAIERSISSALSAAMSWPVPPDGVKR